MEGIVEWLRWLRADLHRDRAEAVGIRSITFNPA